MPQTKRPLRRELNVKQIAFIREYLLSGNGKQSAIKAGYSPHSADVIGCNLLAQPKVRAEMQKLKLEMSDRFTLRAEAILEQLARMVFVDPRAYVDQDGKPVPLHLLSDAAASALQSLEVDVVGGGITRTKYKLVDRGAAVERAMRHLGLFERDKTQGGNAISQLLAEIHGEGSRMPVKP